ncbi:MAG: DegV family protein [Clostridia bacterium]|nr:DegV family protein [Clostridia bacterium]
MADFDIFVDSSANIPDNLRGDIHVIPYLCTINDEEFACTQEAGFSERAKEFYQKMREGADVKTSLIVEERFVEALTPTLEAGKDALLITIASGISGTYNQAINAKKTLAERFPKQKVYVLDSSNASMGEGLLALKVADLRAMGESAETCAEWVTRNAYKMNSYLTVDDLKYLRKGGRISRTLAIAGTLLNIKPLIRADGGTPAKLSAFGKVRGRKKAISSLVEAFDKYVVRPETQTIAITHADCEEDALELAHILKEHGARDVIIEYYDLCSGIHVGPGTLALFFMGKDRKSESLFPAIKPHGKTVTNNA